MKIEVEALTEDRIAAVITLERDCRLSSRGHDGYLKMLQDDSWLLFTAQDEEGRTIAIFSGQIVMDELQIDNIAVAENRRHEGLAKTLLARAVETARQKSVNIAVLEVRSNNEAAIKLYKQQGFAATGRRKNYYQNPPDDALLMSLKLGKHS